MWSASVAALSEFEEASRRAARRAAAGGLGGGGSALDLSADRAFLQISTGRGSASDGLREPQAQ